jgi:hypothetical protein
MTLRSPLMQPMVVRELLRLMALQIWLSRPSVGP